MKRRPNLCVIGVVIGILLLAGACQRSAPPPPAASAPPNSMAAAPPPPEAGYDYFYYPDVEVYYYPASGVYWWYDGGVWVSGPVLPPRFVLRPDVRVPLHLNVAEPWRQHDAVIRDHPFHR
jgi:hypothetical protein